MAARGCDRPVTMSAPAAPAQLMAAPTSLRDTVDGSTRELRPRRHSLRARIAIVVASLGVLAVSAFIALGWSQGWRVQEMTTASMGTAIPVGSLIISRPVDLAALRVGEVVVFKPPGKDSSTFAHRVYSMTPTAFRSKGDLNSTPDPWVLHQANLRGRAVAVLPDAGFVLQMLPWLILGGVIIAFATSRQPRSRRAAIRIGAWSVLLSALTMWFHPLARMVLFGEVIQHGEASAAVVPTGILPLDVHAAGASHVVLVPGQLGAVQVAHITTPGRFRVVGSVHLFGWWWLITLAWTVPILVSAWVSYRDRRLAVPPETLPGPQESTEAALNDPSTKDAGEINLDSIAVQIEQAFVDVLVELDVLTHWACDLSTLAAATPSGKESASLR